MKINLKILTIILGALTALFLIGGLIMLGTSKINIAGSSANGFDYKVNDLLKPEFVKSATKYDKAMNNTTSYGSNARAMQAGAVFTAILTPIFGIATITSGIVWYKQGK